MDGLQWEVGQGLHRGKEAESPVDTLIFNVILLLVIWKFHIMCPNHIYFPALPGSPLTLVSSSKTKEEKEKKIRSPICAAHIVSRAWSNSQWPAP